MNDDEQQRIKLLPTSARTVFRVEGIADHLPRPWFVEIGFSSLLRRMRNNTSDSTLIDHFVAGVKEFVTVVLKHIHHSKKEPMHGRAKPLIALPVLGTGLGGGRDQFGDILQ